MEFQVLFKDFTTLGQTEPPLSLHLQWLTPRRLLNNNIQLHPPLNIFDLPPILPEMVPLHLFSDCLSNGNADYESASMTPTERSTTEIYSLSKTFFLAESMRYKQRKSYLKESQYLAPQPIIRLAEDKVVQSGVHFSI